MSADQSPDPVDPQDDVQNDLPVSEALDIAAEERRGRIIGWGISAAVHALALIGMFFVVFAAKGLPEKETPPPRMVTIDPPAPEQEDRKVERDLEARVDLQIDAPDTPTPSVATKLDVPVEMPVTETQAEVAVPKGREEAVGESEMGGTGSFVQIGAGGSASGMFGARSSSGSKKMAMNRSGGNKGAEAAVDAALRWLKKHQSPDGSWSPIDYWKNCKDEGPKCEPGSLYAHGGDKEAGNTMTATTGFAVLCFLGAGYDQKTPSKYRDTVRKGLQFLLSIQDPTTGALGQRARNYEHPIATMALAEAYAMAPDPALKQKAQKAVDLILKRQNPAVSGKDARPSKLKYGWDYVNPSTRNDSSVTGWNIMALKSAMGANLNVGDSMDGAKQWFEHHWRASNLAPDGKFKTWKEITAADQSRFAYAWTTGEPGLPAPKEGAHQNDKLACIGLVCGVFLGHGPGDPIMESLANFVVANNMPGRYPTNNYYTYYSTMALFQMGGDRWEKWNAKVRDLLVRSQRKTEDCFDGSWDPQGTGSTAFAGRVLSTAMVTLSLEVYYRYAQVHPAKK